MPVLRRTPPPHDPQLDVLLRQAGANAAQTATVLRDLFLGAPEEIDRLAADLDAHERTGDQTTHDIAHRLRELGPGRAPFDLQDGFAIATAIDDIVDYAEQTGALMQVYGVEVAMEQAVELAEVLVAAADRVSKALDGFTSDAAIGPHLTEIHRLENEGDSLGRAALASLFVGGIDPMVVIVWKDIYDELESAIDACETVAIQLESVQLAQG